MVDWRNYTIGTLTVILLISLGIDVGVDDNYVCRDLEITKYCDRLSSTEKTCYPMPGVRTGSKYCATGWEEILKESEPVIIEPIVLEPNIFYFDTSETVYKTENAWYTHSPNNKNCYLYGNLNWGVNCENIK
ncbi:hypothetical protein LCGC14_2553670 [marine sediment metagenome]|uniref:Uncharacterized protein n=1 Tax=marine sediment metagenome TaxID=412755 RepID=A0A0F9BA19_9ZZZZ